MHMLTYWNIKYNYTAVTIIVATTAGMCAIYCNTNISAVCMYMLTSWFIEYIILLITMGPLFLSRHCHGCFFKKHDTFWSYRPSHGKVEISHWRHWYLINIRFNVGWQNWLYINFINLWLIFHIFIYMFHIDNSICIKN